MVVYEFKESVYNKAFDLVDDIKDSGRKIKCAICALEDALYDCYEHSKGEEEWDEEEYYEPEYNEPEYEGGDEQVEINYKHMDPAYRRSMRYRHHEDEDDMNLRRGMRRSMKGMRRMRRMRRSSRY